MRERTSLMWLKNTDMRSSGLQTDALDTSLGRLLFASLRFCYRIRLIVSLHRSPGVCRERISVFFSQIEAMPVE